MTSAAMHDPGRIVRNAATWFGYFLIGLQIYLFNVQGNVIPFLQSEFGLSYGVVGLHSMAMAVGVIVIGLSGKHIAPRLGRRNTLWLASGSMAAGAFLLCIAPGVWVSIPACLIIGLSGGLISSVVPAMMSDMHGNRVSQAFAEQAILAYAFAVFGPLLTGFAVAQGYGWRPAVLVATTMGIALIVVFRSAAIPESREHAAVDRGAPARLPAAFWAYWALLAFSCAFEFSVLLWAPAFLERVVGFDSATAATGAAGFFLGVLAGRLLLRAIVRRVEPRIILLSAFGIGAVGFVAYWVIGTGPFSLIGIFMLGLCIAPQYPLTMALGIGAARGANDAAAVRLTLAFGLAVLIAPAALGALADQIGLSYAHLTLPALLAAAVVSFVVAGILEKRA